MKFSREDVVEHVSEILYDVTETAVLGCGLCQAGVELCLAQAWGVDDPFAPDQTD